MIKDKRLKLILIILFFGMYFTVSEMEYRELQGDGYVTSE